MNPRHILDRAREPLRRLGVELSPSVRFVDDTQVDYGTPGAIYVRRSDLFDQDATDRWRVAVGDDAGWVHLNYLLGADGDIVVSLRSGGERQPGQTPAVNVSVERNPLRIENG
jgi:hypothetical protein